MIFFHLFVSLRDQWCFPIMNFNLQREAVFLTLAQVTKYTRLDFKYKSYLCVSCCREVCLSHDDMKAIHRASFAYYFSVSLPPNATPFKTHSKIQEIWSEFINCTPLLLQAIKLKGWYLQLNQWWRPETKESFSQQSKGKCHVGIRLSINELQ